MAATLTDWLRHLRGRLPADAVPDAELLRRFADTRDETAFSALVARHGPMVFGVCRRVLGHSPDAEDAFQAAFVVLAVRADAVVRVGKVGAWLHGVAFHVARKARDRSARNRLLSLDGVPASEACPAARPEAPPDPDAAHVREKLDEVLAGLPERYRACVVLCDLEGLSRKDASDRLGWSEGTLSGRLARARKLLADRLARRGVTVGAAGLAAVLSAQPLAAAVPPSLAASTLAAVALVGAGLSALPPDLAALTQGVTRAMFPSRFPLVTAGLVGVALLAGVGSYLIANAANPPAPAAPAAAPKPAAGWAMKVMFEMPEGVTAVAFGPGLVAAGDRDGNVTLRDAATGKEVRRVLDATQLDQKSAIDWLAFKPDGSWVYLINQDRTAIHACSLDPNNPLFPGTGSPNGQCFGYFPDGSAFVQTEGNDKSVVVAYKNEFADNRISGQRVARLRHEKDVTHAVFGDLNDRAVTITADGTVRGWDLKAGKELWAVKAENFEPTAVALSVGGVWLAVSGKDGTTRVLDAKTGKEAAKLAGHAGGVNTVTFDPDGKWLATAGDDQTVRVWDRETGKPIVVLKGHGGAVTGVAFSPDGAHLATASADKSVRVWDVKK